MTFRPLRTSLLAVSLALTTPALPARTPPPPDPDLVRMDQTVQRLREEILRLNVEAQRAEDAVLYPAATRSNFFLGVEVNGFLVRGLSIQIDDRPEVPFAFTEAEAGALLRSGGLQRVMRANLEPGEHRLSVRLEGTMADGKGEGEPLTLTYEGRFEKGIAPLDVELRVRPEPRRGFSARGPTLQLRTLESVAP